MRARPIGTVANFSSDDFSVFFRFVPTWNEKCMKHFLGVARARHLNGDGRHLNVTMKKQKPYTINLFGEALLCYVEILVNGLAHRCDCHVTF